MAKWSRFLRGPARRSGEPGAGEGGTAGGSGGGGGSPPSATGGNGGAGGQSGSSGTGNEPPKIPLDVIPEQLRSLSESQIRFHLGQMTAALTATNAKNKQLEERLKEKDRPVPKREPDLPVAPAKPLGDRLLEEPEAALEDWFGRRAAPVIKELEALREQVGQTTISTVRTQFPDWDEHEEKVMELLGESPRTQENIAGAYAMSVGLKAIEDRARARRGADGGSETPAPDGGAPAKKDYAKTALSEEIRVGLGQTEEEYYEKYRKPMAVKVPT